MFLLVKMKLDFFWKGKIIIIIILKQKKKKRKKERKLLLMIIKIKHCTDLSQVIISGCTFLIKDSCFTGAWGFGNQRANYLYKTKKPMVDTAKKNEALPSPIQGKRYNPHLTVESWQFEPSFIRFRMLGQVNHGFTQTSKVIPIKKVFVSTKISCFMKMLSGKIFSFFQLTH